MNRNYEAKICPESEVLPHDCSATLAFILTSQCNEDCGYCILNYGRDKGMKFDASFLSKLDEIDFSRYQHYTWGGGEPGTMSVADVLIFHGYLASRGVPNSAMQILTNGLFLENHAHMFPEFTYNYHIISSQKFVRYQDRFPSYDIEHVYIADSILALEDAECLVNENPDIQFKIKMDYNIENPTDDFFCYMQELSCLPNVEVFVGDNSKVKEFKNKTQYNIYCKLFKRSCVETKTIVMFDEENRRP